MKALRRIAGIVLAAAMMGTIMTGCNNNGGTPQSGTSGSTDAPSGEKIKISWLISGDQSAYKEGNVVETAIEDKFPNLDLTVLKINASDADKLNTTLSGGTIPDVLVYYNVGDFYEDGVIRSITKEMVEENMPKTVAAMREATGETFWTKFINLNDNQLMAVPQFSIAGDTRLSEVVRTDWLKNVGLDGPPTTLDEYYEMIKRFTFDDPDQNGKDDTYGMGCAGLHPDPMVSHFYYVFGAFGVEPSQWQEIDGTVQYSNVTEGYKEALKTLAKWYKEGLIDKDFATTQNTDAINKFLNGSYGVYPAHPSYLDPNNPTGWVQIAKGNNPDAEFELFAPITGPDGKSGTRTYGAVGDWGIMFGANTTDEQVELAMQVGDWLNSDVDMFRMAYFGVEGEHYTMDDRGVVTPKTGFVEAEYGIKCFRTASYINWDIFEVFTAPEVVELTKQAMDYPLIPAAADLRQVKSLAGSAADNTELAKIESEFFFNGITGKIDIDQEWDAYVQRWMDLGGKALTEAAQEAPRLDK